MHSPSDFDRTDAISSNRKVRSVKMAIDVYISWHDDKPRLVCACPFTTSAWTDRSCRIAIAVQAPTNCSPPSAVSAGCSKSRDTSSSFHAGLCSSKE
ncbi:Hypothetical protein NTJ_09817 [Nesidiocoris tenuis]|uniref:Uncharacterized protein n=1 Tax=Nesidiocoris tenuis TaxID=355587 RepID=A0ABN7B0A0_9HEMI|nr:Hypothetical protein NTJ_09817 [Nesidiocoris tenuis]